MNEDKLDRLVSATEETNTLLEVIAWTLVDAHGLTGLNRVLAAREAELADLEVNRLAMEIELQETVDRIRHHSKDV